MEKIKLAIEYSLAFAIVYFGVLLFDAVIFGG